MTEIEKAVKCCLSGQCTGCPRQDKKYPAARSDCKDLLFDYIQDTLREQQERQNRPAPENKPLELHFGYGKIGVSTCRLEGSEIWNELLLWDPKMQQDIGNAIPIADGTTTDDIEVFAKLCFHNAASAQVVVDALNRIILAYHDKQEEG